MCVGSDGAGLTVVGPVLFFFLLLAFTFAKKLQKNGCETLKMLLFTVILASQSIFIFT